MRWRSGLVVLLAVVGGGVVPGSAFASGGRQRDAVARVETPALFDDADGGDADADDPAIWVHPWDRTRTRIIGTAKNGGLRVYDLGGREVQAIAAPAAPGPEDEAGRFNNVDVVSGFRLAGRRTDLAVVTDRGRDQLRVYRIDPATALLTDVTVADAPLLFSDDQDEVNEQATGYGLAMRGDLAVVSRRHATRLGTWRLVERHGRVTYREVDTLDLPGTFTLRDGGSWAPCAEPGEDPQVEGMIVDAENGVLYAGQEDVGLWRIGLGRDGRFGRKSIVERTAEFGVPGTYDPETEECVPDTANDPGEGGRIRADVEGAAIYPTARGEGYLLVSSQGDSTFYVYDRRTNRPLSRFAVVDGPRTDGVQHSDGAAATSVPLPGYPRGLLVLHDGENTPDEGRVSTNFKYVDWRRLNYR
ncbi:phytase [Actinoplanes sp. NBRC 103695]|uniref:phytase n=1 Tax=Actinoplanes sp. NBRC 103695 TaxID=3032202 RepID=UPI002557C594|nr:phytase [Actinoplanes sp. NBRC 103695]